MQGWNGFPMPQGAQPAGWMGYNGMSGAPTIAPPSIGAFSMPQGAQPAGWSGYNTLAAGAGKVPGANGGWFGIQGLGRNLDTLRGGVGLLGGIASLWNASQQNKLAKAAFNHQRGILDTNLANQIKAYNFNLDGTLRGRQVVESTSDAAREEARKRWEARDERRG